MKGGGLWWPELLGAGGERAPAAPSGGRGSSCVWGTVAADLPDADPWARPQTKELESPGKSVF